MIDAIKPTAISGAEMPRITGANPAASSGGLLPADFSEVLSSLSAGAMSTIKSAEAASISGVQGKASVQQVVGAVMEAESTLQTAIVLRDKAVAAYLELSRMAI